MYSVFEQNSVVHFEYSGYCIQSFFRPAFTARAEIRCRGTWNTVMGL